MFLDGGHCYCIKTKFNGYGGYCEYNEMEKLY